VPAGNCKLQTLRQYYRLPERAAHTALGDAGTVADLFATVLRPIAEQRGLETWEQLAAYAAEEWYPSRIAFGQHKGRSIAEARTDAGLRRWLDGLAQSANTRNARMGRWYLRSLEEAAEPSRFVAWECARDPAAVAVASRDMVLYVNPELQWLRALVDAARARLAELEAGFTIEKAKVEAMKARLFARLRERFQRRDRLRLVIGYWRKYLESLVRQGEEEAGKIAQEYRQASAHRIENMRRRRRRRAFVLTSPVSRRLLYSEIARRHRNRTQTSCTGLRHFPNVTLPHHRGGGCGCRHRRASSRDAWW
jgi:hypothetical protein